MQNQVAVSYKNISDEMTTISNIIADLDIKSICNAYGNGASGDVLVGLSGNKKVISVVVPAQYDRDGYIRAIQETAIKLRFCRCNGWVHIRRVKVNKLKCAPDELILLAEIGLTHRNAKSIMQYMINDKNGSNLRESNNVLRDDASRVLESILWL